MFLRRLDVHSTKYVQRQLVAGCSRADAVTFHQAAFTEAISIDDYQNINSGDDDDDDDDDE